MSDSSKHKNQSEQAADYLDRILCQAVEAGADTVELERVPEGLEICFRAASTGIGTVLKDRKLESGLFELVVGRAGLESRAKGTMNWNIRSEDRAIAVEEYDSFGESCFRLKLGKARPRQRLRG